MCRNNLIVALTLIVICSAAAAGAAEPPQELPAPSVEATLAACAGFPLAFFPATAAAFLEDDSAPAREDELGRLNAMVSFLESPGEIPGSDVRFSSSDCGCSYGGSNCVLACECDCENAACECVENCGPVPDFRCRLNCLLGQEACSKYCSINCGLGWP